MLLDLHLYWGHCLFTFKCKYKRANSMYGGREHGTAWCVFVSELPFIHSFIHSFVVTILHPEVLALWSKGHFRNLRVGKKWPCVSHKESLENASNLATLTKCGLTFTFAFGGPFRIFTCKLYICGASNMFYVDVLKECLVFVTAHY